MCQVLLGIKKMIECIKIHNFKSHINTALELDKGINLIVPEPGFPPNNIGKTAILEAIRWLFFNRPISVFPTCFNDSRESGEISTSARFNDGLEVQLSKKIKKEKTISSKYISSIGEFKTGRELPDLIKEAININEINFQNQFDGPFLISSSPGQIAKEINKITNLEEVNKWNSNLTTQINSTNAQVKVLEQERKTVKKQLKKQKYLNAAKKKFNAYKKINKQITDLDKRADDIDALLDKLEEAQGKASIIENKIELKEKHIKKIENIQIKIDKLNDQISSLLEDIDYISKVIELMEKKEKTLKQISIKRKKYITYLKKQKTCPTCGVNLDSKTIKQIMKGI
jgi:DNA repair protein SbcC/Rad50